MKLRLLAGRTRLNTYNRKLAHVTAALGGLRSQSHLVTRLLNDTHRENIPAVIARVLFAAQRLAT